MKIGQKVSSLRVILESRRRVVDDDEKVFHSLESLNSLPFITLQPTKAVIRKFK
jgi:hypothetical protein